MVVSVTASTTSGRPLEQEKLEKVLQACDLALQLDGDKALILRLVQEQMHRIAPNLSTAVGTEIAAKLMGVAGGLRALSQMPACNLQARILAPMHPYIFKHGLVTWWCQMSMWLDCSPTHPPSVSGA